MFSMTEQFTQAQAQNRASLDAQLSMFNSLAVTALDAIEKIVALNLALVKAPFGPSANTISQMRVVSAPQEFVSVTAQTGPDVDTVQASSADLAKVSRSMQHEFFDTTPIPAKPILAAGSGHHPVSIATATANAVADMPKPLARAVAETVTPRAPASPARKLAAISTAPARVPAKLATIEVAAAVAAAAPASTGKTTPASKAIHTKQGDVLAAGKTTAATQAPKLPARSSQPRLQVRKIPGKK